MGDGGGTIDVEELIMGIAKLRGEARRADLVATLLITRSLQASIQELIRLAQAEQEERPVDRALSKQAMIKSITRGCVTTKYSTACDGQHARAMQSTSESRESL